MAFHFRSRIFFHSPVKGDSLKYDKEFLTFLSVKRDSADTLKDFRLILNRP